MDKYDLPDDWDWHNLGDKTVCTINPKKSEVRHYPDSLEVSFVPMACVDEINGTIVKPKKRVLGDVYKGYTYFAENDVVFAKITPCMENGKSAIARGLTNNIGFGTTEFHVLRPGPKLSPEWIYLYVRRTDFRKAAQNSMCGAAGQQRVPVSFLEQSKILVPPLPEQRRIVARIEQLTSRLEKARELQKQVVEETEQCLPSVVSNFFTDGIRSGWYMQPLKKIVTIKYGKGLPKKKRQAGDVPVYGSNGVVGHHNEAITQDPTIIIGRKGSVGEINFSEESCWPIDTAFYIDSFPNQITPYWLYLYLRIAKLPSLVQDGPKPGIRRDRIYETEIPMAPVKEQKKLVDYFQSLRNKSNQLKQLQAETKAELESFLPALLAKAYRGEL